MKKPSQNKKKPSKRSTPRKFRPAPPSTSPLPAPAEAPPKPELMAPAGSLATWAAALDAGADVVYLGLKEFSARAFAANFSLADLSSLVPLTHERGARIFVAFNSLLKEQDLPQAARILDALTRIRPDALIIQDLGLRRLIRQHFPGLEVHASTLMAVHNLEGLHVLARLGFHRAVLARELTLKEIEHLAVRSPLPLEIFIHGAMCFSFSGLCLMSSFLGGKGSLRGACVQPCRRRYTAGKKTGFFFSPTDLDAVEVFGRIRELPVSALKIEGRMKGPEYVSSVVRAYRLILDAPPSDLGEALAEAQEILTASLGRHRSTGFFLSAHPTAGLAPRHAATSGLYVGQFQDAASDGGTVRLKEALEVGDRLRVQFKTDDERRAFTLKKIVVDGRSASRAEPGEIAHLETPFAVSEGDLVFKVGAAGSEQDALNSPLVRAFKSSPGRETPPSARLKGILARLESRPSPRGPASRKPEIWFRLARVEDIGGLSAMNPDRIIVPINRSNIRRAASLKRRLGPLFDRLIWGLPPLVFEPAMGPLRTDLSQLHKMGAREFMISNLGHLPLLQPSQTGGRGRPHRVFADYRLNCLNTLTEAELADAGVQAVTLCIENDDANLRQVLEAPGPIPRLLYLYGQPPLFTSRYSPAGLKDNLPVDSPKGERFRLRSEPDYVMAFAERPIFLAPLLRFKPFSGVKAFIVDLENDPRPLATAREVVDAVNKGRPMKTASRFNLKRGLY